jgi:hypothetical protein
MQYVSSSTTRRKALLLAFRHRRVKRAIREELNERGEGREAETLHREYMWSYFRREPVDVAEARLCGRGRIGENRARPPHPRRRGGKDYCGEHSAPCNQDAVIHSPKTKSPGVQAGTEGILMTRDDHSTPALTSEELDAVEGIFLRAERRRTVEQLRRGRLQKLADTGRCEGQKPYGAYFNEVETLNLILSLRAQRLTTQEITNHLNAQRIPSRTGRRWSHPVVAKILRREFERAATMEG